jgi:hypothetical protein
MLSHVGCVGPRADVTGSRERDEAKSPKDERFSEALPTIED